MQRLGLPIQILLAILCVVAASTAAGQGITLPSQAAAQPGNLLDPSVASPQAGPLPFSSNTIGAAPAPAGDPLAADWLSSRTPLDFQEPAPYDLYLFHGYSGWRGIAEGSGGNNNGFVYGGNLGLRLGALSDLTGIGAQVGVSYGLYDLNGRSSGFADNRIQQQTFVTLGLFRKADDRTNFSAGIAYDAMINDNFGQFAVAPFLSQLRGQIAYAVDDINEIGAWGAMRLNTDTMNLNGPLSYRGVDQINFFWRHKFGFGGDGWTWIGIPDHTKLGGNGSLGGYIFGGTLTAPLSPRLSAYTDLQYMAPSARVGASGAEEETFYIGLGLVFYPHGNARNPSLTDRSWLPYLPVSNNGSFMVDSNRTF